MKAILLAGGGGTRLWPLSVESFPKQFLNFGEGYSLLQRSVLRLLKIPFIEEIVVATNVFQENLVRKQLKKISGGKKINILVEPERKNTAPAIALSIKYLEKSPKDLFLVIPSDHLIEPEIDFQKALFEVQSIAEKGYWITFGIKPTKPETGYGYIQIGECIEPYAYKVEKFIEKPSLFHARRFFEMGNYFWNAGIFLFSAQTFWQELKEHAFLIYEIFQESYAKALENFSALVDLSIDYAVLEKSKKILVSPLSLSWSDVGSWDSVYEIMKKDGDQNVKIGKVFTTDTKNCLILSKKKTTTALGVEDLIIVATDEAVFVAKKGESQKVKSFVCTLRECGAVLDLQGAIPERK